MKKKDEKYDNYVYHTICEKSLSMFEKGDYKTYADYCKFIKTELGLGQEHLQKNKKTVKHIINIADQLELQYSMDSSEMNHYLETYFMEDKYLLFEKQVTEQQELFKNSIN